MLVALIGNKQVLYLKNKYLEIYKDDKSIISATAVVIKGPSEGEYNYKYTVKARTGKYKNKKFIVYINKKNKTLLEYGDLIEIKGEYSAPEVARNYKGFDYSQYLKTLNIYGTIKVELYPDIAPNTVANFITLANRGYYDGKTFHRTVPDFMIQGGSKDGDGKGAPTISDIKDGGSTTETYAIKGEFIANDYSKNTLKMKKGVIAMARADYSNVSSSLTRNGYNSADSQFFIMNADNDNINGLYAGFGEVIEGLDVVNAIANVEVVTRESKADGQDKPVDEPKITSIRVETYGVDYGEPETIEPFNYYNWLMKQYSTTQSSNN